MRGRKLLDREGVYGLEVCWRRRLVSLSLQRVVDQVRRRVRMCMGVRESVRMRRRERVRVRDGMRVRMGVSMRVRRMGMRMRMRVRVRVRV